MRKTAIILTAVALVLGPIFIPSARGTEVLSLDNVGTLTRKTTPSLGRAHLEGSLFLNTADYLRGAFDDVQEDLGDLAVAPTLKAIFRLQENERGGIRKTHLILGTQNGLSDEDPFDDANSPKVWYESNNFAGVALETAGQVLFGLTYSANTSPNDVSDTVPEIIGAVRYEGRNLAGTLSPQAKIVLPLNSNDGIFIGLSAAPSFSPVQGMELSLAIPVEFGVGFNRFYGTEESRAVYGGAGVEGSVPLDFLPSEFGTWSFTAGLHLVVRESRIVEAAGPLDDADNTVVIGRAGVSFIY